MSSPAERANLQGVIFRDGRPVGGVSLPESAADFIAEFNREYERVGLHVEAKPSGEPAGEPNNDS